MGGKNSKQGVNRELEDGVLNSIENENFIGPLPDNNVAILPINQPIIQLYKATTAQRYEEIPLEEVVQWGDKIEVGVNTETRRDYEISFPLSLFIPM